MPADRSVDLRDAKPQRIQRKRTKGWKMPPNTVYVGRPSKWGNPFKVGDHIRGLAGTALPMQIPDAATAVALFRARATDPIAGYVFRENVWKELRGKNLACFCPLNQPCHADILLEIANG